MVVLALAACSRPPHPTTGEPDAPIASDGTGSSSPQQWVVGYYVGYQIDAYPIADIAWAALSHIVFAPVTVTADLTLDLTFSDPHDGVRDARTLAADAHANGVVALLGLGGGGTGAAIANAATPTNRAVFVANLLAALDILGFDGIDLDWEDHVNLDDLVGLAAALRAARPGIVLTYPADTVNGNIEVVDPRMARLATSLDRLFVQTYFPATAGVDAGWHSWFVAPLSGASSTTPVAIDDSLQRYAAIGVPASKLGMGIGLFAICYTSDVTGPRDATTSSTRILGGSNKYPLSAFYAVGATYDNAPVSARKRDAIAKEPYLALTAAVDDPACGASTRYISYEDETSIAAKGAFSKANGYGGTIVWTLEQGYLPATAAAGRTGLIQAVGDSFLR